MTVSGHHKQRLNIGEIHRSIPFSTSENVCGRPEDTDVIQARKVWKWFVKIGTLEQQPKRFGEQIEIEAFDEVTKECRRRQDPDIPVTVTSDEETCPHQMIGIQYRLFERPYEASQYQRQSASSKSQRPHVPEHWKGRSRKNREPEGIKSFMTLALQSRLASQWHFATTVLQGCLIWILQTVLQRCPRQCWKRWCTQRRRFAQQKQNE